MRTLLCGLSFLATASLTSAQDLQPGPNFVAKPSAVPGSTSYAEAARLADFDEDGDLDALVTQGSSFFQLQSQLWKSDASTAGASFAFTNATAGSLPVLLASTLGAEPFDLDQDGDLDLLFANTAQLGAQSVAFLVNQGGAQGGAAGVFLLDLGRYAGLGAAGSSVPPSLLIGSGAFSGGFSDWSAACDFADVDLDGDLDFLQGSVGPSFGGATMQRLFRNDGAGVFSEYNPSSAVSGATSLASGSAAGFAEGTQSNGTTDTTGASHDLTATSFDADFADVDQDYDLDLVLVDRTAQARLFQSRFVENGLSLGTEGAGTRLYRDVTAAAFATLQTGGQMMDLEFGDLDGDDDADLWAVSYANLGDRVLGNGGAGVFTSLGAPQGDPGMDENEVDLLDYDGDGDLDAFVSNFEGTNLLYKSALAQGASTATAAFLRRTGALGVESELASPGTVADSWLSADAGDLDGDRDSDLLVSAGGAGTFAAVHQNALGVPDTRAPRVPRAATLGSTAAGSKARLVAAQAYDNDAFERFRDATAVVKYQVDNGPVKSAPASWAGGNVFRGTIPGWWHGTIQWRIEVTDRNTNQGSSATQSFAAAPAGLASFGSGTPGCAGAQVVSANSVAAPGNSDFAVLTTNCPPNALNLVLQSPTPDLAGSDPLGLGIVLHVSLFDPNLFGLDQPSDATGLGVAPMPIPNNPNLVGQTGHFQTISYWPGACAPSPFDLSTSNALSVTVQP